MHHITIRDQVCNVMASLTKTFLSVPRLSCKTLKRSLLADYHSCCMPFSMVGSTGTVLQNDESAPCKRAVPARSKSGSPPRSRSAGSSGSYVVGKLNMPTKHAKQTSQDFLELAGKTCT